MTVTDPNVYERPWTFAMPLVRSDGYQRNVPPSGSNLRSGNDIASLTQMIVAMRHEKRRFVEHVDFITSPGWIAGDGTHVNPSGAMAYARMLKRAAWSRQRRSAL